MQFRGWKVEMADKILVLGRSPGAGWILYQNNVQRTIHPKRKRFLLVFAISMLAALLLGVVVGTISLKEEEDVEVAQKHSAKTLKDARCALEAEVREFLGEDLDTISNCIFD
jgi:hypothetical protein